MSNSSSTPYHAEQKPSTTCGQEPMTASPSESQIPDLGINPQKRPTPSQDQTSSEVSALLAKQNALIAARDAGLDDDSVAKIRKLKEQIKKKQQALKRKRKNAEYQKTFRDKRRDALKKCISNDPNTIRSVHIQNDPGRPRVEKDGMILEAIVDLVLLKSAADAKRRTEMIRTYRTLDDLHGAIVDLGFSISRSGLYLRLLPKNSSTTEGKRHIRTVPVRKNTDIICKYAFNCA